MSKRIFQVILLALGIMAIITGLMSLVSGLGGSFYNLGINSEITSNVIADSNYRYYSGMWIGTGIILLYIMTAPEKNGILFKAAALLIFFGGLGRFFSLTFFGYPSTLFVIFMCLELLFPLLVLWHGRLVRESAGI